MCSFQLAPNLFSHLNGGLSSRTGQKCGKIFTVLSDPEWGCAENFVVRMRLRSLGGFQPPQDDKVELGAASGDESISREDAVEILRRFSAASG
jgi:hypothetical protein